MARTSTVTPSNSLSTAKQDAFNNKIVEYECNGQTIKLSPVIVRQFLVNGNGNVTDQEVAMFLNLCKFQRLNPFLRECYLVKYGDQPATIVTGRETFDKRAFRNKHFKGKQAGVVLQKEDGTLERRIGSMVLNGETLVGGWATVYVEGYTVPIESQVSLDEYIGRKKDGTVNNQWATKPGTMIRKVALVQALREAFPEEYGGLYSQDEVNTGDVELSEEPVAPVEADFVAEPQNKPVPPTVDDDPLG